MKKVILTEERQEIEKLYENLKSDCKRLGIRQKHIAYELGITQAGVSHLIHDRKLSLEQYVYILCMVRRKESEARYEEIC